MWQRDFEEHVIDKKNPIIRALVALGDGNT